ncbi:PUA-like domain-containing protein [Dimargaris cristalligena]|uniref:PUA-like domain-containing protein n=1 Tax=Dimargaris cristalligena TaxID=215637 RepID=A0A4P9ZPA9_9FUNG|nr:PUA-like domain-containing protein [Dimargaris cristalligena]|eukprot:RKP34402.1 PUA-like domain-containing protein [Dimargaris cristalligena]
MDTYQREWLTECTSSPGIFPGLPSPASGDARLGSITPESSTNTTLYSPGSVDQQALLTELECHICCSLPIRPVTTLCGHTFCQSCLLRTLDHNGACPLCRHSLGRYADYVDHQPNRALVALCEALFPNQMADRHAAEAAEIQQRQLEVPIFVCSLMFPTMPSQLYIYEPRYRLMMRHCLQASQKQFAMCIPGPPSAKIGVGYGRPDPAVMDYGTMMEIKSVRYLPDGQSVVQVRGIYRFRLLSYAMRNEYWTGRLERLDDVDKLEVELEHLNMPRQLMLTCRQFIQRLHESKAPWLINRLEENAGPMPTTPEPFSFWMATVLPIDMYEKYKLLETRSTRERLRMISEWIEKLQTSMFFSNSCNLM